MRLLNKDTKEINKIYISGIVTCLFSEVTSQECIVDKLNLPTEAKANVSCTGKAIVFRMKF